MKTINNSLYIKRPLVSVIMNCHNGEKFLKAAIRSLKLQTYSKWELIFWDNNSSDSSKKIIKLFRDKRIKYFFSSKKTNLYEARNLAIKKAKGKYVSFLDTDDLWLQNKLYDQINFLEKNDKFSMVYSNYFILFNKNKILKYKKKLPSGYIFSKLINFYGIGILTVMLKKKIFKNINFNNKFDIIGDFDFFIKLSKKYRIGYLNKPLALYRIHEDNLSKKKFDIYIKELTYWLIRNKKKINKISIYIKLKFLIYKLILKKIVYSLKGV